MKSSSVALGCIALALGMGASSAPQAAPVKYTYSGSINDIRDFNGTDIETLIPYQAKFNGSFTYDSAAPFAYMIEPGRAMFSGPHEQLTAQVHSLITSGTGGQTQLFDGYNGPDMLFLSASDYTLENLPGTLSGYAVTRIQLYGNIESMRLPAKLNLSDFWGLFQLTGYSPTASAPSYFSWHLGGTIDTLQVAEEVPEPSTYSILALGLLCVGVSRLPKRVKN